jgi:AhpD family alkylhydroperoxidase
MSENPFVSHTIESAPAGSRRAMAAVRQHRGYLPDAVGRLATSPHLLDGFLKLSGMFETTTLDQVAREVVILTIATRNGCHLCVAMHTAALGAVPADPELIAALREGGPLPDGRLEALRRFSLDLLATAGAVGDAELRAFLAHGYTVANALEVVLGIGTYTMSTLANRLVGAELDEQLREFAWTSPAG